jgi:hypothetical protein
MYKECVILHTLYNPRSMSQGGVEYLIHTIQLADASLGGLVPNCIETRTYFYTLGSKCIHQLYINHISFELWPLKIRKRRKNVGSLTNYTLTYSYQNYSQTTLYILIISSKFYPIYPFHFQLFNSCVLLVCKLHILLMNRRAFMVMIICFHH